MFPGWGIMLGSDSLYQMQNSLLFRGGQKLYLSFTSSATWGFSAWVRRSKIGAISPILGSAVKFNANDTLTAGSLTTTSVYRDPTAWMHVSIAAGHLYVNGVDKGAVTTTAFTCSSSNCLGFDGTNYFQGYIAEPAFIDGSQPVSAPGQTDGATGSWTPRPTSATWGTNGVYLGKPWNTANLGADYSGQGNAWTSSGFVASDVVSDSPTNVYATWNNNAVMHFGTWTIADGNLSSSCYDAVGYWPTMLATLGTENTHIYYEVKNTSGSTAGSYNATGFTSKLAQPVSDGAYPQVGGGSWDTDGVMWMGDGRVVHNGGLALTLTGAFATWGADSIRMFACDPTAGKIWLGKDGVWWNSGNPATGANPTITSAGRFFIPARAANGGGGTTLANFGQRTFSYTPPSGFQSLCTANLAATTGKTSGTFTGNANVVGPCVYTGAVPATLTINGNAVTWGTHADKLATGFKLRTSSSSYNSTGTNSWVATYSTPQKPTVGSNKVPANAQGNP